MAPWTAVFQDPLFMDFFRQEYWSGLPFPSPGDLPDPEVKPMPPALAGGFFITEPPEKPNEEINAINKKQYWACQVAQWQRICLQVQETWVRSLGQEDTLEKEMATCSGILAWKIPWIEESGRLQSMGSQRYMTEHACIKGKNNRSEKETWQRISNMCSGG